ncbi:DUF294 nucleotidyltransferase-like domain-containing protein [Agarivorans gilvus]|jgi:CBS domain-containing protein|uniref:Cyclic nucleotide-binding protein n=1 Tax=Agarivorans gilvus TaxID=680279 RepID=A0ABQ1I582_9ALTE|nr:DUF294 nucleotidyltransferase-like domain-containing protein [Agarivorans gilvus]GGB17908.1 cyclic nucleotide-binding protein [Agarivorans gilvus]
MSTDFNFQHPPFDQLDPKQRQQVSTNLDIHYFQSQQKIVTAGEQASYLFIVIKGQVEERADNNAEVFAHYTVEDWFDVRSQFGGYAKHDYVALEETLCYALPSKVFRQLVSENSDFGDYFQRDLATRHQLVESREGNKNLAEFILTTIDEKNVQPAVVIEGETSLQQATVIMREQKLESLLVNHDGCFGMLTGTDLLHAAVLVQQSLDTPVSQLANFNLISVNKGEFLFNAMLLMTRNNIERVVVKEQQKIIGILEMAHVLSLFSTHSHVLALRIARATTIEELSEAAHTLNKLVENLCNNGIRTLFIMKLLATMNEQIISRVFQLSIPHQHHNHICLMVMGSEGRGEQIVKTDQDNGLVIEDGYDWPEKQQQLEQFSQYLLQLGYPPCPGNIMVNNPQWVQQQSQWSETIADWIETGHGDAMMNLAIVLDAHAIAGNKSLLRRLRKDLMAQMANRSVTLAFFAQPALKFHTPLTLFGNIKSKQAGLDIKKGGIFPIVHGIRALALEQAISPTNTLERIEQLAKLKVLDEDTAANLTEALLLFFKLRIQQLFPAESEQDYHVLKVDQLNHSQRDLLRHGLHVVKKFKQLLALHFNIRDY